MDWLKRSLTRVMALCRLGRASFRILPRFFELRNRDPAGAWVFMAKIGSVLLDTRNSGFFGAAEAVLRAVGDGSTSSDTLPPGMRATPINPASDDQVKRWTSETKPRVSIVILNYNKSYLTINCLHGLWRHTHGLPYEIIVIDNGSHPDDFLKLLEFKGPFRLIRLEENRLFGEGNNIAVEEVAGEYIVLMNNDVLVTPNWLPPLMETFMAHPDAGAVGPRFLFPDGRLQEAGALIKPDGRPIQRGKFGNPESRELNIPQQVEYCSAATLLTKRQYYTMVKGLEMCYEPGYYEDTDFQFKLHASGLKTYYCPSSTVYHMENTSGSSLPMQEIIDINRQKFVSRWGKFLSKGMPSMESTGACFSEAAGRRFESEEGSGTHLLRSRRTEGQKRAGFFSPYPLIVGGGERYLLTLAASLTPEYAVDLITPHRYSRLRYEQIAGVFGLNLEDFAPRTYTQVLNEGMYDVFVCLGNEILPPVPALGRKSLYMCQFPFPFPSYEQTRRYSHGHLDGYDVILVNSEFTKRNVEKVFSQTKIPARPVTVVNPPVELMQSNAAKRGSMILNVGRFFMAGHNKRQDFMIDTLRRILSEGPLPNPELHLAGSIHKEPLDLDHYFKLQGSARGLPVHFHPDVSVERLQELYGQASIYWHATGWGVDALREPYRMEHFGITTVEAMSAGCIPVVFDAGGQPEIVEHERTGFLYRNVEELMRFTGRIMEGAAEPWVEDMRRKASDRSRDFSREVFEKRIGELLDNL